MKKWIKFIFILKLTFYFNCFCYSQAPTNTSYSPQSGPIGSEVSISGSNFSNDNSKNHVYFGPEKAELVSSSQTKVLVKVPLGASYETISISNNNLIGFSKDKFNTTFNSAKAFHDKSFEKLEELKVTPDGNFAIYDFAVGDFDNDGKPDLIYSKGNAIRINRNLSTKANVSFEKVFEYTHSAEYPLYISVYDFNADGKLDLILNSNYIVTILINNTPINSSKISFIKEFEIGFGTFIRERMVVGDLDIDGDLDLIGTENNLDGSIFILKNITKPTDKTISFDEKKLIKIGGNLLGTAIKDLDNDNKTEIITTVFYPDSTFDKIIILKNLSNGENIIFENAGNVNIGRGFERFAFERLFGTKNFDLVINEYIGNISVYKNNSTINKIQFDKQEFNREKNFENADGVPFFNDINGDGRIELIFPEQVNRISVLPFKILNDKLEYNEKFSFQTTNQKQITNDIIIADMDMDGKPDFLAANNSETFPLFSNITILRNKIEAPYIKSFYPQNASSGEIIKINGRNFIGINSIEIGKTKVQSFQIVSDSVINFVVPQNVNSGNILVRSITGEDEMEGYTVYKTPQIVSIDPNFGEVGEKIKISGLNFSTNENNQNVLFGSVKAKILEATTKNIVTEIPSGATFGPISISSNNLTSKSINSFPITFGGNLNISKNSFEPKFDINLDFEIRSLAIGDLNGDEKADLVFGRGDFVGRIGIIENESQKGIINSNSFKKNYLYDLSLGLKRTYLADLDNDGKIELIEYNSGSSKFSIYHNNSSNKIRSFSKIVDVLVDGDIRDLEFCDVDLDGRLDICFVGYNTSFKYYYSILKNNSVNGIIDNNTFSKFFFRYALNRPISISTGDIDLDGKPDIVLANNGEDWNTGSFSILMNLSKEGTIDFGPEIEYPVKGNPSSVFCHDLDNNGLLDVGIVDQYFGNLTIFKNTDKRIKINQKNTFYLGSFVYDSAISDLNGDGKPEVIIGYQQFDNPLPKISVLQNKSNLTDIQFKEKVDFKTGDYPLSFSICDVDNDGKQDIITGNGGHSGSISILRNRVNEPLITSFFPLEAHTGDKITILGENFENLNSVNFGKKTAQSKNLISSTTIEAIVGEGSSGEITVETKYGKYSLSGFKYIPSAPVINNILQTPEKNNSTISINGQNFTEIIDIKFGDKSISNFKTDSSSNISFIMCESYLGDIIVKTSGGSVIYKNFNFKTEIQNLTSNILGQNYVCSGKNSNLQGTVSGGISPFGYTWYMNNTILAEKLNSIDITEAASYKLEIIDNRGCKTISPIFEISKRNSPNATILVNGKTSILNGESVNLTIPSNPQQTYKWFKDNKIIVENTTNVYTASDAGKYSAIVTENGCSSQSNEVTINLILSNEINLLPDLKVFPNPSEGIFNIEFSNNSINPIELSILNLKGIEIWSKKIETKGKVSEKVNLTKQPKGVYYILIEKQNKIHTIKLINN